MENLVFVNRKHYHSIADTSDRNPRSMCLLFKATSICIRLSTVHNSGPMHLLVTFIFSFIWSCLPLFVTPLLTPCYVLPVKGFINETTHSKYFEIFYKKHIYIYIFVSLIQPKRALKRGSRKCDIFFSFIKGVSTTM